MKPFKFVAALLVICVASSAQAQTLLEQEITAHKKVFQDFWQADLELKFDKLPKKGGVEDFRVPYAGAIYPDNSGGTVNICRKYDMAFNRGRTSAASYERWDATAHRVTTYRTQSYGFFGRRSSTVAVNQVPYWSGHCNGWTAASIRHAEPKKSVTRNGVTFSPAEIKGLLAELYTYTDTEFIGGGFESIISPAALHIALTNWIGRMHHPVAMEATPGTEIWNFPVYAYNSSSANRGSYVEVKLNMAYKNYTESETNVSPRNSQIKYFHYYLNLNNKGEIVNGGYYNDSSRIDFMWVPMPAAQGGQAGNKRGNPHLNVDNILSLWRESVDEEVVAKWVNLRRPTPPQSETAATESENNESSETEEAATESAAAVLNESEQALAQADETE